MDQIVKDLKGQDKELIIYKEGTGDFWVIEWYFSNTMWWHMQADLLQREEQGNQNLWQKPKCKDVRLQTRQQGRRKGTKMKTKVTEKNERT